MNESPSIIVENVTKIFTINKRRGFVNTLNTVFQNQYKKKLKALDNVSLTVSKGEVLGIIGLNGSGKTTLLRVIAGIYQPDFGVVKVNDNLAPLLHLGPGFQGDLIASENIIMYGMLLGMSKQEISEKVNEIIEYAELQQFSNLELKHFSAGMRARLGFSAAMHVNCDVLLVDEILAVGDRLFREKTQEVFESFKKNKKTILHSTHNLEKLSEYSDRILLLDKGSVKMIGKPDEVIEKYKEIKRRTN